MQRTPDLLRLQQWLWRALRHAQQIPLPQPYAHLLQHAHLFVPLNPFGQYLTTQIAANAADRLHELPLDRVPVQVADEMLVDLDELRLQLGPESRSEERRVGKECSSRGGREAQKKKRLRRLRARACVDAR